MVVFHVIVSVVVSLQSLMLAHFVCFRLALYVYEYLLHVGAQKAAQTFLSEVSTCPAVASESGGSAGVAGLS